MSITQSQLDQINSKRATLVRISPRRYMTTDAVLYSGAIYSYQFDFGDTFLSIQSVEVNGVEAIDQATLGDISGSLQYYVDTANQVVYFNATNAPLTADDHVVAIYNLFYTDGPGLYMNATPDSGGSPIRFWQSRMRQAPTIKQSAKNALSGVLSVEASNIELNNADNEFAKYLTDDDSFRDCAVDIWLYVDSTATLQQVYSGRGNAVTCQKTVIINLYDAFAKLRQRALYENEITDAFFYSDSSFVTALDPRFVGAPVRHVLGPFTRWRSRPHATFFGNELLDHNYLIEAVCTNFSTNLSTSRNRVWTLCRSPETLATVTWSSSIYAVSDLGDTTLLTFLDADYATMNVVIGDSVKITEGGATAWGVITSITHTDVAPARYTLSIKTNRTTTAGFTTAATLTNYPACSIVIVAATGEVYVAAYNNDFTIANTALTSPSINDVFQITFVNNFESHANFSTVSESGVTMGTLDPGKHRVFFRLRFTDSGVSDHGAFLKSLCEQVGMDTANATFTAADSALDARILWCKPEIESNQYGTYVDDAQQIIDSTLGYLSVNSDGEAQYDLLEAPSSGDTIDQSNYLKSSLSCEVVYSDIVTDIVAKNPNDYFDSNGNGDSVASVSSDRAKHLHKLNNVFEMNHVLSDISARINDHLAVRSRPLVFYKFETASRDLLSDISDDITLSDSLVPGGSDNLKVISVEKSPTKVKITAIPVDGL